MALKYNYNYYGIETASTPEWTVSSDMYAKVVDAAGAQTIRVALGGTLEIQGSSGANTFILEGVKQADCYIYRAGTTTVIAHKGIEIFRDTATSTGQSIVFGGDTNNTLTLVNSGGVKLGGVLLNTLETTAPVFASATVDGASLVMSYTEANLLDPTNIPLAGAFAVMVDGVANIVTAVAINGTAKTVTLTLTTAVTSGQVVTVAYTDPTAGNDANALQDAAGNDAASLAATTVTNNTLGDVIAPTLSSSTPADNTIAVAVASNIVLAFSETIQAGSGNIVISDGTDTHTISIGDTSQVTINGNTVTINPSVDLAAGSTYSVQMASGVLEDAAGNAYAGLTDSTTLNFSTLDAVNNTVKMAVEQASDYLTHELTFGIDTALTVTGSGSALAAMASGVYALGNGGITLNASDNNVSLTASQALAIYQYGGVVFDSGDAITVTGSGNALAALASGIHALGGSNILLNASDDVVTMTATQVKNTLDSGGVAFASNDVITVSGVSPISLLTSSLISLGGKSIALDVDVDTSSSVAMDAGTANGVSAGHWYFDAVGDNLTYWDSASSGLAHTIALTGVSDVTVSGVGIITLVI